MSTRRMGAAAATAALALTLAACGSDAGNTGSGDSGSSGAAASGLKIGIKFDQPGLGLKKGSDYTGFDVDVAKYVAKESARMPRTSPGCRRPAPSARP